MPNPASGSNQLRGVTLSPNWEWPQPHGATPEQMDAEVGAACELGSNLVRLVVKWHLLEPRPGQIDESYADYVDGVLASAARCRMRVILTLLGTPCWASSDPERDTPGLHEFGLAHLPAPGLEPVQQHRRARP